MIVSPLQSLKRGVKIRYKLMLSWDHNLDMKVYSRLNSYQGKSQLLTYLLEIKSAFSLQRIQILESNLHC